MCQLTSLAMVMNAMGIKRKRSDCQFEDELYDIANLAGYGGSRLWTQTIDVYNCILPKYSKFISFKDYYENVITYSKAFIGKGIPVIKSMDYKEDGCHGHVTVVVGYIDNNLIVNDPYGDVNSSYSQHNGAFVEYNPKKWMYEKKWCGIISKN